MYHQLRTRQEIIAQYWLGVDDYLHQNRNLVEKNFKNDVKETLVKAYSIGLREAPIVVGFALVVAEYCARVAVPSIGCPTQVAEDQLHKPVHKVTKFLVIHYGHSIYPPSTEDEYASTLKAMGILWLRGQLFK